MRRLLLCIGTENPYEGDEGYWTYTISMSEAYAKAQGIDFKYVQLKDAHEGRHVSWSRIQVIKQYVAAYDEILYMSSTATIIDPKRDAFAYLKTAPVLASWPSVEDVRPVVYAVCDKPVNAQHVSSGVFLIDCTRKQEAQSFLDDWWKDVPEEKFKTSAPYEQSVWNLEWAKHPRKASRIRVADVWTAQEFDPDQVFINLIDAYQLVRLFEAKKYFYRCAHSGKCSKKIGMFVRQQNYYTNGAGQNCIFMKQSLEATGHTVDLLVVNPDAKQPVVSTSMPYIYTDFAKVDTGAYCMFVFGSFLPGGAELERIKQSGVPVAMFNPCNPYDQFHNDNFLYSCKSAPTPLFEMQFHKFANQIWLTENHKDAAKTYLEVLNRNATPVNPVPLVWSPLFLYNNGKLPMYTDRKGPKIDIVILEPNINYSKSGWLPLVACEKLYLEHPELLNKVYFFNTPDSNSTAMGMIQSLRICEDKKLRTLARLPINEILDFFANKQRAEGHHVVFLSHQTRVPMNYAYYDVLYTGFPFVHNSKYLHDRNLGYYYHDADLTGAVNAVLAAKDAHRVDASVEKVRKLTLEKDPYSPSSIQTFQQLLMCHRAPARKHANLDAPLVLTYDNNPTQNTQFYLETLKHNNWEYALVGEGSQWTGWKGRAAAYRRALEDYDEKKVVVLTDARDVMCLRNPKAFMEGFATFKSQLIVSMELSCGGIISEDAKASSNCVPLVQYWNYFRFNTKQDIPMRRYVNAGLLAGTVHGVRQFLDYFLSSPHTDDQIALAHYMNHFPDRVATDHEATLLHTTNFGINGGIQDVRIQAKDSPTVAELCGRAAFFLHIPHGISKGQEFLYKSTRKMVESGLTEQEVNAIYNFKQVGFNEKHVPA